MTDKQIIIDGVDVADCEHINACDKKMKCVILQDDVCETNPYCEGFNCYYKQLKAKEQECEELKEAQKNSRCAWKSFEGTFCPEAQEQLDQLKAENEEFKKKCNIYTCGICGNKEDCNKLYKTLTEIKEVLQFYNNTTIGTYKGNGIFEFEVSNDNVLGGKLIYCYDTNPAKKALQKISEVLE